MKFDAERATQLLSEATGGERVKFELLFNPPGQNLLGWPYPLIAQYLQAVLQPIGFDVELKQLEAAAVTDALNTGEYQVAISNNCWSTGDPNYMVRRTLGSIGCSRRPSTAATTIRRSMRCWTRRRSSSTPRADRALQAGPGDRGGGGRNRAAVRSADDHRL